MTYFSSPNMGQPVTFSDLKMLPHCSSLCSPALLGVLLAGAGFVKWHLSWDSASKRLVGHPHPTSLLDIGVGL